MRNFSDGLLRILILPIIFVVHAAGLFWLYGGGAKSFGFLLPVFGAEFVVLYLPSFVAFALYFLALRMKAGPNASFGKGSAILISCLLTFLSFGAGMFMALNKYGS